MRVLVAPDSFKGTLTAAAATDAMAGGVLQACPGAQVDRCPLSDGGEGFAEVLAGSLGGARRVEARVAGPNGDAVTASFLLTDDGTALVESASVIGLGLVPEARRRALETTTRGVGELILRALDEGARRLVIGLGGTATTDGGAGLAQALGVRFGGVTDAVLGGRLTDVRGVDAKGRDARLAGVHVLSLTDVDDPLTGPAGAARRYSPQKGASAREVELLENALVHFAREVGDPGAHPGDGAAGGLGYGLRVFARAERRRGIDHVLDAVDFDARVRGADLVLTGEGRFDVQSASGKVVSGVAARSAAQGVPVVVLAGSASADARARPPRGVTGIRTLEEEASATEDPMTQAAALLSRLAARVTGAYVTAAPR